MNEKHYYDGVKITPREYSLLQHLAEGWAFKDIHKAMGISDNNCRVILTRLLPKINLISYKEAGLCKARLDACVDTPPTRSQQQKKVKKITPMQTAVLLEIMRGKLPHEAGKLLGISHSAAKKHVTEGLSRLGLAGMARIEMLDELKEIFATPAADMDDPAFS